MNSKIVNIFYKKSSWILLIILFVMFIVMGWLQQEYLSGLLNRKDANILELAFESGFNTKGAFYNAFKRITEVTPK